MTLNELFLTVLPRLGKEVPVGTFIDAVNAVQGVIADRIWLADSDLLRNTFTGVIRAGKCRVTMPSGTLGLAEFPWITNPQLSPGRELRQLEPSRRYTFLDEGNPEFFEQRGLQLLVYPTALIDTTIKCEVYSRPCTLETMYDDLPWDGMFDQVFVEVAPRFNVSGGIISITPEMQSFIQQRIDLLINHRPAKDITWRYSA